MRKPNNFLLAALAVVVFAGAPAFAGGPLANCQSGVPFLWPNGGMNIEYNLDQGDLGPVTAAGASALIRDAFDAWENIPTSTISYFEGALLPVDVDITNFGPFLNPVAPDGLSAIVFDDTGEIFDLLFGPGTGILGFAGPEWLNPAVCEILEGVSFLNGPSFTDLTAALDVSVHEFGHFSNFSHTIVNGQQFIGVGDTTGPEPNNTFPGIDPFADIIETMYPFYFGPAVGTRTPEADDVAIASTLYPEANFFADFGTISGTIFAPNGTTRLTGVNVIARNIVDPFEDTASAISSDFTDGTAQSDPVVGTYAINGLTPGAQYVVYVDEIEAGGFSTTPSSPLPGPEEFHNGLDESNDITSPDDPSVSTPVDAVAGVATTGIDVIFNAPAPGDPLGVGDDGSVQLFMPFTFCIHGQAFDSVNVNANGSLTFGAGDADFSESPAEFRDGPPRIAALWDDLNPAAGGVVTFDQTASSFTVSWEDVPEWLATGSNTFSITLRDNSRDCVDDGDSDSGSDSDSDSDSHGNRSRGRYGDVSITYTNVEIADGLAGVTGGLAVTNGIEAEVDLSAISRGGRRKIKVDKSAAVYEDFFDGDNDLNGLTLKFFKVGKAFKDKFERNNSLDRASKIGTPFDTLDTRRAYSAIDPPAGDIDFYRFGMDAGTTLIAQVTRGQIDSVMGLWFCPDDDGDSDSDSGSDSDSDSDSDHVGKCDPDTAIFLGFNDDAGIGSNPLLSAFLFPVPVTGTYGLAVTFCCDFDFDGVDPGQGAPFDGGRYILDLQSVDGTLIALGDDSSLEVPISFSFPYQGGSFSSVFVNSNGNLTFGSGDTDFSESVGELLGGPPRIAPLWDDLSPNNGGLVFFKDEGTSFRVTFQDVPEFLTTGANTFSVTLSDDGSVDIDYGDITAPDGLAGVTEGGGAADPGETDLSAAGALSASGTTYENFDGGDNDLSGASLGFDP